jgi:hypothetical protein
MRKAIDVILTAHRPYPAFVIDRHWTPPTTPQCPATYPPSRRTGAASRQLP